MRIRTTYKVIIVIMTECYVNKTNLCDEQLWGEGVGGSNEKLESLRIIILLITSGIYKVVFRRWVVVLGTLDIILMCCSSVDGGFSDWSAWVTCSVTCGGGRQGRDRTCTNPAPQYGGSACVGNFTSEQDCNTHECPSMLLSENCLTKLVL